MRLDSCIAAGIAGIFMLGSACFAFARNSARDEIRLVPERAGGVYLAYPENEIDTVAMSVPDGYEPFYVSHYGRHGSRYLISDRDYSSLIDVLRKAADAGALSPLGLDVLARADSVWIEAEGRGGELTPLGTRQHRNIARRLAKAYPSVFSGDDVRVTAASTPVMRCAHSMFAFIEGLKESFPQLDIPRESSPRNLYYLNYHSPESGPYSGEQGPWFQDFKRFRSAKTQPARLIASLFADQGYVKEWVDTEWLMWQLYWLAVDMQNMETGLSFFDLFTNDELYDLWQVANFNFYACNSSYPRAKGLHVRNAVNLVSDILATADDYVASHRHGATLRFGHDGNIIPLTALLKLDGCYSDAVDPERLADDYANYRISPMASNLQMIFFRNKRNANDVKVQIKLNEKPIGLPLPDAGRKGLYRWSDLRGYLQKIVDSGKD